MDVYYLNDTFLTEADAKISVLDLGLLRGYGVFDYLRTYQKGPFHLEDHLERLKYSASQLGLSINISLNKIAEIINEMLKISTHQELSIKILITGGISSDQFTPAKNSSLIIFAYELKTPPRVHYLEGIATITTTQTRTLPMSKTLNYIPGILALQQNKEAKEALYLNAKRELLEGTTTNIFAIKNNTLITPHSDELLLGITREIILNLAKENFEIHEGPIVYADLEHYDEFFLTSSSREILPVKKIDNHIIGNGKPGKGTIKLQELFANYTQKGSWMPLGITRYHDRKIPSQDPFALTMPAENLF